MPTIHYFWDEIEDNVVREYDENNNTLASYTSARLFLCHAGLTEEHYVENAT